MLTVEYRWMYTLKGKFEGKLILNWTGKNWNRLKMLFQCSNFTHDSD